MSKATALGAPAVATIAILNATDAATAAKSGAVPHFSAEAAPQPRNAGGAYVRVR
jgi:hypothetical protein